MADLSGAGWTQAVPNPEVKIDAAARAVYGEALQGDGPVTIEEITGAENDRRRVVLTDRAKPYKPLSFGGEHRIESTEYDGYPQISQQPLGAKELESEWKGAWKTRFIGDTGSGGFDTMITVHGTSTTLIDGDEVIGNSDSRVLNAADAAELFDDIRRKGKVIRVSWLHLVRVGRLAEFHQDWQTPHDVDWRMKWKWIGKDEDAGLPSPGGATATAVSAQLTSIYVGLQTQTDFDGIDTLDPGVANLIDARVGRIQSAVLDLEDAVSNQVDAITDSAAALRRALTVSAFVADECQTMIDELGAIPGAVGVLTPQAQSPTTMGNSSGYQSPLQREGDLTGVPPGQSTAAAIAFQLSIQQARALKHAAGRQKFAALKQIDGSALAVVVLGQDEDLRKISREFYGTSDDAEKIRAYNQLLGYSPPQGTVVVVPQQKAGTTGGSK